MNATPMQYIVCSHAWTFLEGAKGHAHTLKAGRHLFPFELQLGGSLPSSLATYVNGGASIAYKLRATAVRAGRLASNLSASKPVTLLRAFVPEALEYQQTLEIENTWPEKLMYALMLPHKAWAAGDEMTALVKFAPLQKGVKVRSVTTNVCETTRTLAKGGHLERTRVVVSRRHDIVGGRAVPAEEITRRWLQGEAAPVAGPSRSAGATSPAYPMGSANASAFVSGTSSPVHDASLVLSRPHSHDSSPGSSGHSTASVNASSPTINIPHTDDTSASQDGASAASDESNDTSEISTTLSIHLPSSLTPTHTLDPVLVGYRIRWSVLLANSDGHTSELRCSLPIVVLDGSLRAEALAATRETRRLLFGVAVGAAGMHADGDDDNGEGRGADAESGGYGDAGSSQWQLPSYPAHVRDRVATVEIDPASLPMPISQSWPQSLSVTAPSSGAATPALERASLDMAPITAGTTTSSPDSSRSNSRPASRAEGDGASHAGERSSTGRWPPRFSLSRRASRSRMQSRAGSPSPESMSVPLPSVGGITASRSGSALDELSHHQPQPHVNSQVQATHIHAAPASRAPAGLFNAEMRAVAPGGLGLGRGFGALSAPWAAHAHVQAVTSHFQMHARAQAAAHAGVAGSGATTPGDELLLSAASTPGGLAESAPSTSAVPDYFTAARAGAGGGVVPLESLRGLPTYDEAEQQARGGAASVSTSASTSASSLGATSRGSQEGRVAAVAMNDAQRSFSDSDLVAHFARTHQRAGVLPMQRVR